MCGCVFFRCGVVVVCAARFLPSHNFNLQLFLLLVIIIIIIARDDECNFIVPFHELCVYVV